MRLSCVLGEVKRASGSGLQDIRPMAIGSEGWRRQGGDWPFLLRRWRPWGVLRRRIFQGPWVLGASCGSSQDHLLGQRLKEVPCGHRWGGDVRLGPGTALAASALLPGLRAPS